MQAAADRCPAGRARPGPAPVDVGRPCAGRWSCRSSALRVAKTRLVRGERPRRRTSGWRWRWPWTRSRPRWRARGRRVLVVTDDPVARERSPRPARSCCRTRRTPASTRRCRTGPPSRRPAGRADGVGAAAADLPALRPDELAAALRRHVRPRRRRSSPTPAAPDGAADRRAGPAALRPRFGPGVGRGARPPARSTLPATGRRCGGTSTPRPTCWPRPSSGLGPATSAWTASHAAP